MIQVLIVDDSPELRELLRTTIEIDPELISIGEVGNGYEALSFCEIVVPDLILMDLMMPNCDGIKGTGLIKHIFPMVKVLVMTGTATEHNLHKALEAGADGYFLKGIETPKLRKTIKNTINGIPTIDKEVFIP
jgi:DNA-binding NarL/FixJ family response regulator